MIALNNISYDSSPALMAFSRDAIKQKTAMLFLRNGKRFDAYGFGAKTYKTGELCFNTAMSGYQEILTDPSYAQQMVCFTFPHIGIVGTNDDDCESHKSFINGCIMRAMPTSPSNYRSLKHLHQWLEKRDIPAIYGVDTRAITKELRDSGASDCLLWHYGDDDIDDQILHQKLSQFSGLEGLDLAKHVTCEHAYDWHDGAWHHQGYQQPTSPLYKVAVLDYGVKHNILRELAQRGCQIRVFPAQSSYEEIMAWQPHGIFLSNGPGDPAATGAYAVPLVQKFLATDMPIFGICLGHQILALALGAKTIKMAFGHHGANHPIYDKQRQQVLISSQNHGFNVADDGLPDNIIVTHRSLFDQSLAGLRLRDKPVFSVQYHPEASPGPHDSHYLFDEFTSFLQKNA